MSPLDIKSPTSVDSELMVADMLEDHHHHHQHHQTIGIGKRKRNHETDMDELNARKLSSLAGNNNDVSFVLEDQVAEDALHDDPDDVRYFSLENTRNC